MLGVVGVQRDLRRDAAYGVHHAPAHRFLEQLQAGVKVASLLVHAGPVSYTHLSLENECSHTEARRTSEQTMEFQRRDIPIDQVIYKRAALRSHRKGDVYKRQC